MGHRSAIDSKAGACCLIMLRGTRVRKGHLRAIFISAQDKHNSDETARLDTQTYSRSQSRVHAKASANVQTQIAHKQMIPDIHHTFIHYALNS